MVLKIKLSHEQTVHEKGLSLYKNCTSSSVSLNWDKEAAASNSLLSSSSELDFIRIKKQSQWKKQSVQWDFPVLLPTQQSYKVIPVYPAALWIRLLLH